MKKFIEVPNEFESTTVIFIDYIVSILDTKENNSIYNATIYTINNSVRTTLTYKEIIDLFN